MLFRRCIYSMSQIFTTYDIYLYPTFLSPLVMLMQVYLLISYIHTAILSHVHVCKKSEIKYLFWRANIFNASFSSFYLSRHGTTMAYIFSTRLHSLSFHLHYLCVSNISYISCCITPLCSAYYFVTPKSFLTGFVD